jgi:hypothetical protein
MGEARFARLFERLAIHERHHQHFAGFGMLDDSRQQARRVERRHEAAPLLPLGAFGFIAGYGLFLSDSREDAPRGCGLVAR